MNQHANETQRPPVDRRAPDRRRDPMSDEAVEEALLFLNDFADKAGKARADVTYMENFRKMTLARLRRAAPESSNDAKDNWARVHPDYIKVVEGQREAVAYQEKLFWKRTAAVATIEAWRTRSANQRGATTMR
jgi:hypothetical protein